jgi:hypothetical protein
MPVIGLVCHKPSTLFHSLFHMVSKRVLGHVRSILLFSLHELLDTDISWSYILESCPRTRNIHTLALSATVFQLQNPAKDCSLLPYAAPRLRFLVCPPEADTSARLGRFPP